MNSDDIQKELTELTRNAKDPVIPKVFDDERLEDAFKVPIYDENGYAESLPAIYGSYGYGQYPDGVKILSLRSASLETRLYSKYLDEEALVWDSVKEELFLYVPDPNGPRVAFKGSNWQFAKRLKPEYKDFISLRTIYEGNIHDFKK